MALSIPPAIRREFRDLLVCLSAGSLVFARFGYEMQSLQTGKHDYFRSAPAPPISEMLILAIAASVLTAVFFRLCWFAVRWSANRHIKTLGHCGFLLILTLALDSVCNYLLHTDTSGAGWGGAIILFGLEGLLLFGIVRRALGDERIVHSARRAVAAVAVFLPVSALQFWAPPTVNPADLAPRPNLPFLAQDSTASRFLWVLFDEFDPHIAFDARPDSLAMPNLDRLRGESLVAARALPLDAWTLLAVPSLLTGKQLSDAKAVDKDTLLVSSPERREPHSWREETNVFARARALHVNSGVVGWYHPYCRILDGSTSTCFWEPGAGATNALQIQEHLHGVSMAEGLSFLFRLEGERLMSAFTVRPGNGFYPVQTKLIRTRQMREFLATRDRAYEVAADPRIGLGFLHFPAPHMYPIYNRAAGRFEMNDSLDYLDNLALVDLVAGEIREKLERQGLWERTTILISSDHGLRGHLWNKGINWPKKMDDLAIRPADYAVPFILKLAGDTRPLVFETPFSAVMTADLALAVLSGEIVTNAQAAEWLDARVSSLNTPRYYRSIGHTDEKDLLDNGNAAVDSGL